MPLPHILLAILINAAWGWNFIAIRVGLQDMDPIFYAALRFLIMLLLLLPWLRWKPGRMKPVLLAALFGGPLHFGGVFLGTALLDHASSASILTQLSVPTTMILAVLMLHETIGKWRLFGMCLSFAGAAILSFDPRLFAHLDGVGVMLLSQLAYSFSAIFMRQVKDFSLLEMQAWIAVISMPGLIGMSLFFESGQIDQLANISMAGMAALAYTIVGASIIGHGGAYFLYQRHPVSSIMPFLLLNPFFATTAAILLLDEAVTWRMVLGGLVISAGVGLVIFRERQHLRKQEPA